MPDLLFEIRCEELPALTLRGAAGSMRAALESALGAAGLPAADVAAMWTPRRIVLFARALGDRTPDRAERVKGPRTSAAFDASGAPTKAAEGFARKNGADPAQLERDGDFVWATVRTPGRAARDVVAEILPALPAKAGWRKTMRWGVSATFARPIRGVVALLGDAIVPCDVAGVAAGRETRGHPFLSPEPIALASADRGVYVAVLRSANVLVDPDERRRAVVDAARAASWEADLRDDRLVEEVTNLVERPSALLGNFSADFLRLPERLLTTVMAHHQRFFPVRAADGRLLPHFVAILDRGPESVEPSRRGFERVLVPRLHDAVFFFEEDRKRPLADRLEKLRTVTYHRALGTLHDKTSHMRRVVAAVARALHGAGHEPGREIAAAELAKCDLVTLLVGEFPELQGHVGSVYARADGVDPEVADAIDWQYRHDFSADDAPGPVALALLLAENVQIVCLFGTHVGLPTGSADPFGVRRAAITLLDAAERWAPHVDIGALVRTVVPVLPKLVDGSPVDDASLDPAPVLVYLDTRLRQRLRDRGTRADFVEAVTEWRSVGEFVHKVRVLETLSAESEFDRLLEVAERCRNITRKADAATGDVDPALLGEPAERDLWDAYARLHASLPAHGLLDEAHARAIAATLAAPLHRFFADVFVNADDAGLRRNRLSLLTEIDRLLQRLGDLTKVVRKGA